jgi:DNA-binding NarL/FixJ family response regulator
MTPIRIVVVDDHVLFRHGLRKLFEDRPEFSIVGEASNSEEAIRLAGRLVFDVMLLDLQLNDCSGLDVLRRIGPDRKFQTILMAADVQRKEEVSAVLLGVSGILRKSADSETLFKSIRSVVAGEIWVDRDLIKGVVEILRNPRRSSGPPVRQFGLTPRELDVIKAVVQGLSNKAISQTLGISAFTVKHYLTRIFSKLLVNNRVELVLFATRQGLVGNSKSPKI